MESPVELVIFDCDGVLVDTERIALRVQLRIGAELGWPLTEDEVVELFMGRSLVSMAEVVRPWATGRRRWGAAGSRSTTGKRSTRGWRPSMV